MHEKNDKVRLMTTGSMKCARLSVVMHLSLSLSGNYDGNKKYAAERFESSCVQPKLVDRAVFYICV